MGACATQTLTNVTSSVWSCLVQKAQGYGITISGNSGQASQSGFTIRWDYDPSGQTLQLQCVDSPWWAPCSTINGKIHDFVNGCMGGQ